MFSMLNLPRKWVADVRQMLGLVVTLVWVFKFARVGTIKQSLTVKFICDGIHSLRGPLLLDLFESVVSLPSTPKMK